MTTITYNFKLDECFISMLGHEVMWWRDAKPKDSNGVESEQSFLGKVSRRLCCGVALATLSIAGVIEAITGLALAILLFPLQLTTKYQYSGKLLDRTLEAALYTVLFLTFFQLTNITCDKVA